MQGNALNEGRDKKAKVTDEKKGYAKFQSIHKCLIRKGMTKIKIVLEMLEMGAFLLKIVCRYDTISSEREVKNKNTQIR